MQLQGAKCIAGEGTLVTHVRCKMFCSARKHTALLLRLPSVARRIVRICSLQGESARLLGVDRVGQATAELRLDAKELVSDAVVKYSR